MPSDRLAALAGFASQMQVVLEDEYCPKLWKGDLFRGLLWNHGRHHGAGYSIANDEGGLRGRISDHRGAGPVWRGNWTLGRTRSRVAEVIDIQIDALDGSNLNRVSGGQLVITAPFFS